MFRRRDEEQADTQAAQPEQRITSVLGDGTTYHGKLTGRGGVRIEGAFEGEISLEGMLVVGTTGRVTCEDLRANTVVVAGAVRGNITAEKVEIRASGRVWGDVVTIAFSTEEGAFLRGQIRMEEEIELGTEEEPQAEEIGETEEEVVMEEADGKEEKPKPKRKRASKKASTKN
ncbi:MAG: polymer-forming cytoskeletal protein [Chloroflexi bacterium]|nr:MAG: polymer-forming cytoskeletal protein [Chloroflexota bacterium]MBL1194549.1 polymer-forming cytoskeletal protein [Chloroflexota bacterium]NOH11837.1 polymer-forming cytoskeletal protein [Chloroflexota bacterium]